MDDHKFSKEDIEFIRNVLRQGSVKWSGRAECLRLARKKTFVRRSKKGKPIYKYMWKCAKCERWFRNETDLEVDHIVEIGSFEGDWNEFIKKHFPRPVSDHLQALCLGCHMKKTLAYNSARTKYKRRV